ncbi:MAG: hypothetical protein ACRDZ9_08410 [Acidimicrobiales bacterium]
MAGRETGVMSERGLHLRRAALAVVGAGAMELAIGVGPLRFVWVPLFAGLISIGIAAVGGRRHGYWAPAVLLTSLGVAAGTLLTWDLDVSLASGLALAGGIGTLVAEGARRRGFDVGLLNVGTCLVAFATLFVLVDLWPAVFGRAEPYALGYLAWAAYEAALATPTLAVARSG